MCWGAKGFLGDTKVFFLGHQSLGWDTKDFFLGRRKMFLIFFGSQRGLINCNIVMSKAATVWGSTVGGPKSSKTAAMNPKAVCPNPEKVAP